MSSSKIEEDERSRMLDIFRFKIERYSLKLLMKAVDEELSNSKTFVYKLFLQNVKFARKI